MLWHSSSPKRHRAWRKRGNPGRSGNGNPYVRCRRDRTRGRAYVSEDRLTRVSKAEAIAHLKRVGDTLVLGQTLTPYGFGLSQNFVSGRGPMRPHTRYGHIFNEENSFRC